MIENPPTFKISSQCCKYAKKDIAKEYLKQNNVELNCIGVRKYEGGVRDSVYKNCFTQGKNGKCDQYRPIFWFTDEDKEIYKNFFGIRYSDCYEVYGMKRTGCTGCPYGKNLKEDLELIEKCEPNLFKAANNIFKDAYEYRKKYEEFKKKMNEKYGSYAAYLRMKNED